MTTRTIYTVIFYINSNLHNFEQKCIVEFQTKNNQQKYVNWTRRAMRKRQLRINEFETIFQSLLLKFATFIVI